MENSPQPAWNEDSRPVLITEAQASYAEQYAARKRRYGIIMGARIPCLLLAGIFYQTWWIALTFIILSVPLPWIAVIIANDRPALKSERVNRFRRNRNVREIESGPHPVIEG